MKAPDVNMLSEIIDGFDDFVRGLGYVGVDGNLWAGNVSMASDIVETPVILRRVKDCLDYLEYEVATDYLKQAF